MNHLLRNFIFDLLVQPLIRLVDFLFPKVSRCWGFAVHHIKSDQFVENARAVFEYVKADSGIEKIIFSRTDDPDYGIEGAENTRIVRLQSLRGLYWLLRCRVLFVMHSIAMDYSFRWGEKQFSIPKLDLRKRAVVNLWHGIPLKALYALANPGVRARLDRVRYRRMERSRYTGLISSSKIDRCSMTACFHPIHPDRVWMTGLPRNDFLVQEFKGLPSYLQKQISGVRALKNGRRLVVYAPTYRQTAAVADAACYQFTADEIARLREVLRKHDAVFGFRMHYFRNSGSLFNMEKYIDNEWIVDLGHAVVPEVACVIREADLVITDYSSVYVDALYLDKPILGFAYDLDQYLKNQDGLLYDMDVAFPGPVVQDFSSLLGEVDRGLSGRQLTGSDPYRIAQKIFFEYRDGRNAERVVARVKAAIQAPYKYL